jgi:hypothetical protein
MSIDVFTDEKRAKVSVAIANPTNQFMDLKKVKR